MCDRGSDADLRLQSMGAIVEEFSPTDAAVLGSRVAANVGAAIKVPESVLREILVALLARALARLGLEPAPGTTLSALERRLADSQGERAAAYVRSLREIRYRVPGAAVAPSAAERRGLRRSLTAGRGPRARLRGLLALPPRMSLK